MSSQPTAPDTSVLVAGFDPNRESHDRAAESLVAVRDRGVLVAHTIAECYAVLTSSAFLAPPAQVRAYLDQFLARQPVGLPPSEVPASISRLADAGVVGGAVYDGLIALAARAAGATLVSLDVRAAATYERCEVDYAMLR